MFQYIIYDVAKLMKYGPLAATVGLACMLVWSIVTIKKEQEFSQGKAFLVFLLGAYLVVVTKLAIIDRVPDLHKGQIELSLLHATKWANMRAMTIENILMFIPYGLLCPIIFDSLKKWYIAVPLGIACSITIEGIQFFTGRGYCQLEDLVMNTAGILIGYLIFKIINRLRSFS